MYYYDTGFSFVDKNIFAGNPSNGNQEHSKSGQGIGGNIEDLPRYDTPDADTGALISNNVVLGGNSGIWVNSVAQGAVDDGFRLGVFAYHNTVIGQNNQAIYTNITSAKAPGLIHSEWHGNLLRAPSSTQECDLFTGATVSYNGFSSNPESACDGTGDEYGDPAFQTMTVSLGE